MAVRAAAVLLALFAGLGAGAYLLAWALLPDQTGRTHVEEALHGGRPRSVVVAGLGLIALLGVVGHVLRAPVLPVLAVAALAAYVVTRPKQRTLGA